MIDVKIGKKVVGTFKDKELEEDILDFIRLKTILDETNYYLKGIKKDIALKAKALLKDKNEATLTFIVKDIAIKVNFGWSTSIRDKDKLFGILGDRFDDLVITKVSYTPTKKLNEMVLKDEGIKECISIKEKAATIAIARG